MINLFEKYGSEASAKDGGFVFQAIISHDIEWSMAGGELQFDPKNINAFLHQVDVFPDMKFTEGYATSTYVILSEVNILKRKFELANEAIKKRIKPEYANEILALAQTGGDTAKRKEINEKYFKGTQFRAKLTTSNVVLREVSTSGLDSGAPRIVLKLSTGMVNTLDGAPINSWDSFKLEVTGDGSLTITNSTPEKISEIKEHDDIENRDDLIFMTIIPSLSLEFKGDRTIVDTYSNRSAEVSANILIDYKNLFSVEDETASAIADDEK